MYCYNQVDSGRLDSTRTKLLLSENEAPVLVFAVRKRILLVQVILHHMLRKSTKLPRRILETLSNQTFSIKSTRTVVVLILLTKLMSMVALNESSLTVMVLLQGTVVNPVCNILIYKGMENKNAVYQTTTTDQHRQKTEKETERTSLVSARNMTRTDRSLNIVVSKYSLTWAGHLRWVSETKL